METSECQCICCTETFTTPPFPLILDGEHRVCGWVRFVVCDAPPQVGTIGVFINGEKRRIYRTQFGIDSLFKHCSIFAHSRKAVCIANGKPMNLLSLPAFKSAALKEHEFAKFTCISNAIIRSTTFAVKEHVEAGEMNAFKRQRLRAKYNLHDCPGYTANMSEFESCPWNEDIVKYLMERGLLPPLVKVNRRYGHWEQEFRKNIPMIECTFQHPDGSLVKGVHIHAFNLQFYAEHDQ